MCTLESVAANRPSYFNRTSFAQGHPPFPRAISSPLPPPPPLPVARNFTPEHPNEGALLSRFLRQINLEPQRVTPFSQVASYRHFFSRANDAQLVVNHARSGLTRVESRLPSFIAFRGLKAQAPTSCENRPRHPATFARLRRERATVGEPTFMRRLSTVAEREGGRLTSTMTLGLLPGSTFSGTPPSLAASGERARVPSTPPNSPPR
jgi:hypothetical protein